MTTQACDLCDHEEIGLELKEHNGRKLCEQCYMGEVDNPEHALPAVE